MLTNRGAKANTVHIEGILSEIDLSETTYTKKDTGAQVNAIRGTVKVRLAQKLSKTDAEPTVLEIPIRVFANEFTNAGAPNPGYENAKRVMNEFVSIAASDEEHADKVRITGASIRMNEYYNQNGNLVAFPIINASFITKITNNEYAPQANFDMTVAIGNKGYELDKDGVETDRYKATVILPQWNGEVDVLPVYPANKNVASVMSSPSNFEEGSTWILHGNLNFSAKVERTVRHVDFGDDVEETRTVSVSELLVTGGNIVDDGFDADEISEALKHRKVRLTDLKEAAAKRPKKATPAPSAGKGFKDLGF